MPNLNKDIANFLQNQLTRERINDATYSGLAASLRFDKWDGCAEFMEHAAQEEQEHARLIRDYLTARNTRPTWDKLPDVSTGSGKKQVEYFQTALELEERTTQSLTDIYMVALNAGDVETMVFLQPLISEQTKSAGNLQDIIRLAAAKPDPLVFDELMGRANG